MKLLTQLETAQRVGYAITQFATIIKHQHDFPKPKKAHPKAHPKWRDVEIDEWLNKN